MKTMKIVVSLFALILLVNIVESSVSFNNKPTATQCCENGAEAVGINGVNGHCEPCWNV